MTSSQGAEGDAAFSIPSSDRMAASQVQRPAHRGRAEPFQYPFVGSNGCIRPGSALQSGAAHAAFQYPFVGSNGCIARLGQRPDRISRGFQYPFVGSNGCIARRTSPSAGRMWLSVSLRRIECLHPSLGTVIVTGRLVAFSIPSSDRMAASPPLPELQSLAEQAFSIPSSDRMAASPLVPVERPARLALSVSLRRIEWLHHPAGTPSTHPLRQTFSIPSSDRMAASWALGRCLVRRDGPFSIPSSDRMAASARGRNRNRRVRRLFQYPFVGSNGCIAGLHRRVRPDRGPGFQYPFVGSNGCIPRMRRALERVA